MNSKIILLELFITIGIALSGCTDGLEKECIGIYKLDTKSDTLLNDKCIQLIVEENHLFVFINNCNILYGTWEMQHNEFLPITFTDYRTHKVNVAHYGKGSTIDFLNPNLLLNDEKIKNITFVKSLN